MDSWALQPRTNSDNNSKKCVTCMFVPQTKYLMPRTLYTLDLGLILYHIPVNTIVKIENILPTCKILNTFWVASHKILTLTLIAETFTILYRGTPLCKLYPLPAECLLPGNHTIIPNKKSYEYGLYLGFFLVPSFLSVRARKHVQYYGRSFRVLKYSKIF